MKRRKYPIDRECNFDQYVTTMMIHLKGKLLQCFPSVLCLLAIYQKLLTRP
jgi:hypothetical protein